MKYFFASSMLLIGLFSSISFANNNNIIEWRGQKTDKTLSSDGQQFRVVSKHKLENHSPSNFPTVEDNTLVLGFPKKLIGSENVFGGVVTAESNAKDQDLGGLKLADVTPMHVKTVLSADATKLSLMGCNANCNEDSTPAELFAIPVVKTDDQYVYLDLTAFGSRLDFFVEAGVPGIESLNTVVRRFDFSLSTLVFDVENTYPFPTEENAEATFALTTRWYLKLASGFTPGFVPRLPISQVGYFTTSRGEKTFIQRFPLEANTESLAKYYIKNVPPEFRQAFADSFEDWNQRTASVVGKKFFTYEFLETTDPRYNQINIGDIRYNVLEWDLVNQAGYGGLGPAVASQKTGETFSANVLVQGPRILELYKKWWRVSNDSKSMEKKGLLKAAQALRMKYINEMARQTENKTKANLTLGSLKFNVHSANPTVSDPAMDGSDFFDTPAGYTFSTYMYGYFRDMVTHELGHNLGLRHNFKGNLGSDDSGRIGSVSRSVMEYLGREFRHLDRVGAYDIMAVAYGYKNVLPEYSDWFCTDEDQVSSENFGHSAECSSTDAKNDPYSFLISQLHKSLNFLVLPGSEMAPVWTVSALTAQIKPIITNLANYYVSSFSNAKNWTNFLSDKRKISPDESPRFILSTIAEEICSPALIDAIALKTPAGREQALSNLRDFKTVFKTITEEYKKPESGFTDQNFPCLAE